MCGIAPTRLVCAAQGRSGIPRSTWQRGLPDHPVQDSVAEAAAVDSAGRMRCERKHPEHREIDEIDGTIVGRLCVVNDRVHRCL